MRWRGALLAAALATPAGSQPLPATSWQGSYVCAQGETGLSLAITPSRDAGSATAVPVRALFRFYALPSNPDVPDGCFEMTGSVDPASGLVELAPARWVLRPPGYVMVGLSGAIGPGGDSMAGTVGGPGCTAFGMRRAAAPLPEMRACRASPVAALP